MLTKCNGSFLFFIRSLQQSTQCTSKSVYQCASEIVTRSVSCQSISRQLIRLSCQLISRLRPAVRPHSSMLVHSPMLHTCTAAVQQSSALTGSLVPAAGPLPPKTLQLGLRNLQQSPREADDRDASTASTRAIRQSVRPRVARVGTSNTCAHRPWKPSMGGLGSGVFCGCRSLISTKSRSSECL